VFNYEFMMIGYSRSGKDIGW